MHERKLDVILMAQVSMYSDIFKLPFWRDRCLKNRVNYCNDSMLVKIGARIGCTVMMLGQSFFQNW